MHKFRGKVCLYVLAFSFMFAGNVMAQRKSIAPLQHLGFDTPEAWALKYFTSVTLLSGLQPPETLVEERRAGSITIGMEVGWLPALTPEQARVGFSGKKQEDLNKAPIFARPSIRVGLPWRFSVVAAGPAPLDVFGITPRLFALGLERPILQREHFALSWRGYGQLGSVKGAFTCPKQALGFPGGSAGNPSGCIAESNDVVSLRYAGTEAEVAYRLPRMPRLIPHAAAGVNFIDSVFHVNAPLQTTDDHTRLWTRGMTFSGSAGVSYLLTKRMAFTVDAFYTPLGVRRVAAGPRVNDGLFNLRALISYTLR
jgi:hypothetical protein